MGQRAGYQRAAEEQQQRAQQQQLNEAQQQAATAQQQLQQTQAQQVSAPAGGGASVTAELQRLAELHRSGAVSDEEFAAAKRKILGT